jgi:hypothetical protein
MKNKGIRLKAEEIKKQDSQTVTLKGNPAVQLC